MVPRGTDDRAAGAPLLRDLPEGRGERRHAAPRPRPPAVGLPRGARPARPEGAAARLPRRRRPGVSRPGVSRPGGRRPVGARAHDAAMSDAHRHHAIDYVEIPVTDLPEAERFYAGAFGWRFTSYGPGYSGIRDPRDDTAEVGGLRLADEVPAGGALALML